MLELPEARCISQQLNQAVQGKKITEIIAAQSPHKFAWFAGDPKDYPGKLLNKTFGPAENIGGMVQIKVDDMLLVFMEGVRLRFCRPDETRPKKHQLLLGFEDDTYLYGSIQMYGGLCCFKPGDFKKDYYQAAISKPSPFTGDFNAVYFESLITARDVQKTSVKAFLATEQRIPGLGNGILQDILFNAKIHPRKKTSSLTADQINNLFRSIKDTINEMADKNGRDTEKDIFGNPGKYTTKCSKNTVGKPCSECGSEILKANYMGGSVYFCKDCQVI